MRWTSQSCDDADLQSLSFSALVTALSLGKKDAPFQSLATGEKNETGDPCLQNNISLLLEKPTKNFIGKLMFGRIGFVQALKNNS